MTVWLGAVALLVMFEHQFIFFPRGQLDATPAAFGLDADEIRVAAADGTWLHGWWIRGRGVLTLVWYHGNAGNISHRLDNARLLVDELGVDILLVDYRGYGLSEGAPTEEGLYQDGLAMYDAARARTTSAESIVLFGRSLGAAVAVFVARHRAAKAVILETPFLSIPALARRLYPFVPPALIRTQFDTESTIGEVRAPVLIFWAGRDEIVPADHPQRLFERVSSPKRLVAIPGAGHNDTYLVGGAPYIDAWHEFLDLAR